MLGAVAVGLLAWAGARLFDRRVGLVAAALLAVAFLPVHYAHFALNDVPTLAPLCLALVGVGGVFARGRLLRLRARRRRARARLRDQVHRRDRAAAAAGGGRWSGRARPTLRRLGGLVLAGVLALAFFLIANPFALLDFDSFRDGLSEQSAASSDGGGKLGLTASSGILYYLGTTTWGLGWVPALAALGGAVALAVRDWRRALVLVPALVVFLLFMGTQDRFFARWLLPRLPARCACSPPTARCCWRLGARARSAGRAPRGRAAAAGVLLCAQGLVFAIHNDVVLARDDTRQLARDWMVENVPAGHQGGDRAGDARTRGRATPGRALRGRPATARAGASGRPRARGSSADGTPRKGGLGPIVKLEDYERTLFPRLVTPVRATAATARC